MSDPTTDADAWLDDLAEGVVGVAEGRVTQLNLAAADMLEVDREWAVGMPLIAVLRDHRLEQAFFEARPIELYTRGRTLVARPTIWGLLLRDVSEVRASQAGSRELLAVLSHELRTPVTTIRAALEALALDLSPEQRRRFLGQAETESVRLVRLLEDLTVEVAPPRARSVELSGVIERAGGILRPTLEAHRVRFRSEVGDAVVWADPDKVLQVVVNLMENAAIHGPNEATVLIVSSADPDLPGSLLLSVCDEGDPLDPEQIEEMFEPHARGSSAKAKGTGLGLYIVRSIAESWGGRARGASVKGGNVFSVSIPIVRPKS